MYMQEYNFRIEMLKRRTNNINQKTNLIQEA